MHLSIRDVGTNPQWLAKISAFLHDASVSDPGRYEAATQTFTLSMARIGYEFRVWEAGLIGKWRMPYVPAVLVLTPVLLLTPEEDPGGRWDGDQLLDIELATPSEVQLKTREGVISLSCVGPATLTVSDSGPPEPRPSVTDVGALILPSALITEIINTSVA